MRKGISSLAVGMVAMSGLVFSAEPPSMPQQPLYLGSTQGVPGHLVFASLFGSENGGQVLHDAGYSAEVDFNGYFDSDKCYLYRFSPLEPERHFLPARVAQDRDCGGEDEWSGNFLNWASATPRDIYRQVLTGGYRVRDEVTETWLQPAVSGLAGGGGLRKIRGTEVVKGATPFETEAGFPVSEVAVIAGAGGPSLIMLPGLTSGVNETSDTFVQDYNPDNYPAEGENETTEYGYRVAIRMKVCDASIGVEANCVNGEGGLKPEGLAHRYDHVLGYSAVAETKAGGDFVAQGRDSVIDYLNGANGHNDDADVGTFDELQALAFRYFKNENGSETDDPVRYRCQANAVLALGGGRSAGQSALDGGAEPTVVHRIEDARPDMDGNQTVTLYRVDGWEDLENRLESVFEDILATNEANGAGVSADSVNDLSGTVLFGASFNPSLGTGDLRAVPAGEVGDVPADNQASLWQAGDVLDSRDLQTNPRALYTYNRDVGSGVAFTPGSLADFSKHMRGDLNQGDVAAAERVRYFQGDRKSVV